MVRHQAVFHIDFETWEDPVEAKHKEQVLESKSLERHQAVFRIDFETSGPDCTVEWDQRYCHGSVQDSAK